MSEYTKVGFDKIVYDTDEALLLDFGEPDNHWIPRSCIDMDGLDMDDHDNIVYIVTWLADKLRLEEIE